MMPVRAARQRGVVLLLLLAVLGLGAASLLMSGMGRFDTRAAPERRTGAALKEARDALIGYAVAHGRLPRPARDAASGREFDGRCDSEQSCTGLLPWTTLGIAPGDGWGRLLRYSVTPAMTVSPIDPAQPGTKRVLTRQRERLVYLAGSADCTRGAPAGAANADPHASPDANSSASAAPGAGASPGTNAGATPGAAAASTAEPIPCAAAVILSNGRDNYGISLAGIPQRGRTSGNRDERANALSSTVFMLRARSDARHPGGEFDDQLAWITPAALAKRTQRARVQTRTE